MVAMPDEQEYRTKMFEYIDTVTKQVKEEVKEVCDTRFNGVIVAVDNAAAKNVEAISALTDSLEEFKESLSVTAKVEGLAKDGVGLLGKARNLSKGLFLFTKDILSGGVVFLIAISAVNGNLNWHEILKFILKITGFE